MLRLINLLYSSFFNPYLYNHVTLFNKLEALHYHRLKDKRSVAVKLFSTLVNMDEFHTTELFEFARTQILEAGKILRDGMHSNKNVETKEGQHDVVTYFDRKTEEALINSLSGKFPDHKFIAEESSYKKNVMLTDSPTWIIDPIDGTTNFVHAFPFACISVALAIHKEVVLGIIYNPSNFEMYTAVKGKGSFLNDEPINTSKITELNKALLGCEPGLMRDGIKNREFKETRIKALINVTQGSRAIGSAALTMAYIARGVIDCFQMDTLQPWDIAAGMLIIREAGGVVVNSKGGQLDFMKPDLLAAANETLMHKAVSVLEQTEKNK